MWEDDNISNLKTLFVFLIVILAIGAVSHVSAQDLDNATIADGEDNNTDDLPVPDGITYVGGDCDHVGELDSPTSASVDVEIIQIEGQNPGSAKIQLSQSGSYYGEKTLKVKVVDANGTGLFSVPVDLKFSNGKSVTVVTKSDGEASYKIPFNPGTYSVNAKVTSNILKVNDTRLDNIKIKDAPAAIKVKKLTTSFGAKKYFQIKVTNSKTKRALGGVKLLVKVYTKGKAKRIRLTTNSKGIAKFSAAKLDVGIHKVKVSEISRFVSAKAKVSKIRVKKAPTTFLDEVGAIYIKKGGVYNIALFNKHTEKPIKGIKLTVKVFVGKKAKKYVVKTGRHGADIDLGYLGLGSYRVSVKFDGNSRYCKCTKSDYIDVIRSSGHVLFKA